MAGCDHDGVIDLHSIITIARCRMGLLLPYLRFVMNHHTISGISHQGTALHFPRLTVFVHLLDSGVEPDQWLQGVENDIISDILPYYLMADIVSRLVLPGVALQFYKGCRNVIGQALVGRSLRFSYSVSFKGQRKHTLVVHVPNQHQVEHFPKLPGSYSKTGSRIEMESRRDISVQVVFSHQSACRT